MKIHPFKHKEDNETLHTWSSQRQFTEMGSQVGLIQTHSGFLQPINNNIRKYRAKTVKNFIQLSTTATISPTNSQRQDRKLQFQKLIRKIINAQHFIEELRNYAEQLRTQNLRYAYKRRSLLPLFPDDIPYIIWGLIINLCTDFAAILFPLQVAFDFEGVGSQLTLAIQIIFWLDLIMNFFICHVNKQLDLIYNFKDIAQHYLSGWFMFDLISVLPDFNLTGLKILKLIRLFRFFLFERRVAYNQSLDLLKHEYNLDLRLKKLMKIFMEMIVLNHLFACLWLWICRFNENTNWLSYYNFNEKDQFTQLVQAFFWAYQTITVIGYGDIEAHNSDEYLLVNIWMLIGVGYYSFTIGNITFILIQSNPNQEFDDQLFNLEDISVNMPEWMQDDLFRFTKYNIQYNPFWADDAKRILSELPHPLILYMMAAVHKEIFRTIPFMSNDINFSAAILPNCSLACYQQFETIYHIGQSANDFYFLIKGDVRLCDAHGESIISVMEGTCFGEIESIEYTPRCWSALALQESIVLMCSAHFFSEQLQNESPQFFELQQMYKRRKIILFQQAKLKRQKLNKIRRGHAINENQYLNRKNTIAQQLDNLKQKFDNRPYQSVQQDLMLQIVGQKQARFEIIRERFVKAISKVKYYVQKSKKIQNISVDDPDYRIIQSLINNRVVNSAWSKQKSKKFGQKLLSNFVKVCDDEEMIKSFILKSKQESIDRIMRKKLVHIIRNIAKFQKKEKVDKNKIDLFYGKCHSLIYEEIKSEKLEERKKQKQKLESIQQEKRIRTQIQALNSNFKLLQKFQTSISMAIFEINQHEFEIDALISELKQQLLLVQI
ncbi:unnamed protein product (macronuclear) [Paramecium tetraurelia]|uniref:Cyclic nucleotide-binding domain-containing protein n=1 Tax=Paramecium tetraurelia TaxID=5888 RepID=A0BEJ3_PARTE|nr:uncharacterized protein GSPATT00027993001 [Paramecium tetraurelia]CAK56960.1 unnamed protein product [Paramecium tetraurelia]|eukprot:XP_001424358.1 hypothetical protein (macronuclear) [Paramecium tetraurelia strain d4-2]